MTVEPLWEPMTRAWLLIKLKDGFPEEEKGELAQRIYHYWRHESDYKDNPKVFVIRVDVVTGPYDLIAPVYTDDDYEHYPEKLTVLRDIECQIEDSAEVDTVERAIVDQHIPDPSWDTYGFITYQEVNSPGRGPTSHRPW